MLDSKCADSLQYAIEFFININNLILNLHTIFLVYFKVYNRS